MGAILLATSPAAANLVANPGFETGAYAPEWTANPGGGFDQVCKDGDPIGAAICTVNTGLYAMSFGTAGATDDFYQDIPTVAGELYSLTFYLANDNPVNANTTTFEVFWDGQSILSVPSPQPTFPFQRYEFTDLSATTSSTRLLFRARHDPSQWFLDDVWVRPTLAIPTLGQWGLALLALALAGVALARLSR